MENPFASIGLETSREDSEIAGIYQVLHRRHEVGYREIGLGETSVAEQPHHVLQFRDGTRWFFETPWNWLDRASDAEGASDLDRQRAYIERLSERVGIEIRTFEHVENLPEIVR